MDNLQIKEIYDRFQAAIQKNRNCRPVSYDPGADICAEQDESGLHIFMEVPHKLLWFHTYCKENGINGRIEADEVNVTMYSQDTGLAVAKARVLLNNEPIASAVAGKRFDLNDNIDTIDLAVQTAAGRALSRALSNAGFGIFSSLAEEADASAPAPISQGLPFSLPFGADPTNAPVSCSYQQQGNHITAHQPSSSVPSMNPENAIQMSIPNADPLAWARMTVWTGKGQNNGQTLGQILMSNPGLIEWIANSYRKDDNIRKAALELLPEAKQKLGRA